MVHQPNFGSAISRSRRGFLRTAVAVPSCAMAGSLLITSTPTAFADAGLQSDAVDYTTREAFDRVDLAFNNGEGYRDETNDSDSSGLSGKLAWGEAYGLQGYALMYQAHRDTHYLDRMVDHIDRVLANRDSERGVSDFSGASHPAWRTDNPYTVGYATVPNADGIPVLEVRSALAHADTCTVTVSPGSADGLFDLDVENAQYSRRTIHRDLSTDGKSPNYAVTRVRDGFQTESPDRVLVTVRDLRNAGQQAEVATGTYRMRSPHYIFEVHTGQIVQPLALFAAIVKADPALQANPTYRNRAEVYLAAAADAVAVHDSEWRVNDRGEGYYVTQQDAPVWHAGIDNPLNHILALGRAVVQLAVVTGKQTYIDRADAMARTLLSSLSTDSNGAFSWPYWWPRGAAYAGWDIDAPRSEYRPWYPGNTVPEDTSHGQIEVNFALESYRALLSLRRGTRPPITGDDLRSFAATYEHNVATVEDGWPTVHRFVDGSGATGNLSYERQAAAWAGLTPWNGAVLEQLRSMYGQRPEGAGAAGSSLLCVGSLNHAAHVKRRR